MKRTTFTATLVLAFAAASPAPAQVVAPAIDAADRNRQAQSLGAPVLRADGGSAPLLYDGELEDFGPQFLVLEKPDWQFFEYSTDLQIRWTDNATLAEQNEGSSTLSVWSNQIAFLPRPFDGLGGTIDLRGGVRHQFYRYGYLDGRDDLVTGLPAKSNDFDAIQPFVTARLKKGVYQCGVGLYYNELTRTGDDDGFYDEIVPHWFVRRDFRLGPSSLIVLQYDGNWRESDTETPSILGQSSDWNDRTDHALSAIYARAWGKCVLQPAVQVNYANYTGSGRDREDWGALLSVNASYYFRPNAALRLFANYELRESGGDLGERGPDYEVKDIGLGGALSLRF